MAAAFIVICLVLSSCKMQELTRVSPQEFPEPQSCAHCHVEIYQEWQNSPHAGAFTNPRFLAATDNHRFEQCLGCHAPEAEMVQSEPAARTEARNLGVTCVSCHLDHGAMVGPLEPTGMVQPHPIRVDRAPFENGRLCGHCHEGTLAQFQLAKHESDTDCRQCHMPGVIRKTTQATSALSKVLVAAEKTAPEHRHLFMLTPENLSAPAITIEIQKKNNQATLQLINNLPHNLPTGDYGVRIVEISADGIDDHGHVLSLGHWELTNAASGFLASGQSREWTFNLPVAVHKLRATVLRHGRDDANVAILLKREVVLQ